MSAEIVRRDDFALGLTQAEGEVTWSALKLLDPEMPWERFEGIAEQVGKVGRWSQFAIGDLVDFGEAVYGERAYQVDVALGRSPKTLENYASVARRVLPDNRLEGLSWTHHREVTKVPTAEQREWLEAAKAGGWTVGRFRARLAEAGYKTVGPPDPGPESLERLEQASPQGENLPSTHEGRSDPTLAPVSQPPMSQVDAVAGARREAEALSARELLRLVRAEAVERGDGFWIPGRLMGEICAALGEETPGQLALIERGKRTYQTDPKWRH